MDAPKILVDAKALREIVAAFQGPQHHVLEIFHTQKIPGNPAVALLDQYNDEVKLINEHLDTHSALGAKFAEYCAGLVTAHGPNTPENLRMRIRGFQALMVKSSELSASEPEESSPEAP